MRANQFNLLFVSGMFLIPVRLVITSSAQRATTRKLKTVRTIEPMKSKNK